MKPYTIRDFEKDFPDDAACLDWLRAHLYPNGIRCPNCKRVTKHHRIKSRPSYSCDECGHHVHPTADTIFHKSPTPLRLWFYAIFMISSTRCGTSAKQLERELGVTYKTAWRMFSKIRKMLARRSPILGGTHKPVELDETYIGSRRQGKRGRPAPGESKVPVFGMVERRGQIMATVVSDVQQVSLMPHIKARVLPRSIVYTDELGSYNPLRGMGYRHSRIHHAQKVYVRGDVHTNTIDGFWALIKNGIGGVYHGVSTKHLQAYLDEYTFRYNHRKDERPMFRTILSCVEKSDPAGPPSQGLS